MESRFKLLHIDRIDSLLLDSLLDNGKGVVRVSDVFDGLAHRGHHLVFAGDHLLHPNDVGELFLYGEDLHFLIEGNWVNTWNPHTLLVVEFVLEVLDVVVLQFRWHGTDFVKQLVVILVHYDLFLVHHVVKVELIHLFEREGFNSDQVAVFAMTLCDILITWP